MNLSTQQPLSIVNLIHRLIESGCNQPQAEIIADVIERSQENTKKQINEISLIVNKQAELIKEQRHEIEAQHHTLEIIQSREPATKQDLHVVKKELQIEIEKLRYDTLKFIVWTGATVVITLVGTLGGIMAKGFGWF